MSKVLEWLVVGDLEHAIEYASNYKYILSVMEFNPCVSNDAVWIQLEDCKAFDREKLNQAIENLLDLVANGSIDFEKDLILVHCRKGISRSVTVTAAFMMEFMQMDLNHALRLIRIARPIARPNSGFMRYLREKDTRLRYHIEFPRRICFWGDNSSFVSKRLVGVKRFNARREYWDGLILKRFCVYGSTNIDAGELGIALNVFEEIKDMLNDSTLPKQNRIYAIDIIRMLIIDEFFFRLFVEHYPGKEMISWVLELDLLSYDDIAWCITLSRVIANILCMAQEFEISCIIGASEMNLLFTISKKILLNCKNMHCIEKESAVEFAFEGLIAVTAILEYLGVEPQ